MSAKRTVLLVIALSVSTLTNATTASANFHAWTIQEAFSNADGTIQFIELSTTANGQQFLSGHFLAVEDSLGVIAQLDFLTNLASGTAGKSFLLGTQNLADLEGGVTPDYVIPTGFIDPTSADFLNFANVNTFLLSGLPLDGFNSLDSNGLSNVATPLNYAGETGVVPEPGSGLLLATGLFGLATRRSRRP